MYLLCGLFVVESNQDRKDTKMALLDEKKLPLVALFDMTDVNDNIQSYVDDAMNSSLIKILEEKTKEAVAAEIKLVQNCSMMIQQIVPSAQDIGKVKYLLLYQLLHNKVKFLYFICYLCSRQGNVTFLVSNLYTSIRVCQEYLTVEPFNRSTQAVPYPTFLDS